MSGFFRRRNLSAIVAVLLAAVTLGFVAIEQAYGNSCEDALVVEEASLRDWLKTYDHLATEVVEQMTKGIPDSLDRTQLLRVARHALVESIVEFDPTVSIAFPRFAIRKMKGAVLTQMRNESWVGKTGRADLQRFDLVEAQLRGSLGREPTEYEVATALKQPFHEFQKRMRSLRGAAIAFISNLAIELRTPGPTQSKLAALEARIVGELTPTESSLWDMIAVRKLGLQEIATTLGWTQSHVAHTTNLMAEKIAQRIERI